MTAEDFQVGIVQKKALNDDLKKIRELLLTLRIQIVKFESVVKLSGG